jgi:hypothetical protein
MNLTFACEARELNPNSAVQMSEGRTWSSEDTQPYSFKVFFRSQAIA